jgi:DNA-binding transcriptional ArsR family regulator
MSASAAGRAGRVIVDDAPAYDALVALCAVAQPRFLKRSDWRTWAETVASGLSVEQWRRLRVWFAGAMAGYSLVALAPLLTGERSLGDLADALEALPPGDLARIVVTAEMIAPQTPLDAADLLALRGDLPAARHFCDRYLRTSGRQRAAALRTLVAPEETRTELLATLREFDAQVFSALAPRLSDERARGASALRAQIEREGKAPPAFINGHDNVRGFSPIIIGMSTLLGDAHSLYYHDTDHTLIDGRDYEPFIVIVGARLALGLAPRRRGAGLAEGAERFADPATRWATLYTALADPSRLQIVRLLSERPHYGQELAAALGMSGATISHHLGALSKAGVLGVERQAHRTYFVLDQPTLRALLRQGEQFALGEPTETAETSAESPDDRAVESAAHDTHEGRA